MEIQQSMKDVLLVGPYPPPFGGPNVHMVYLRRHLERRGVDCQVLNIGPRRRENIDGVWSVQSGVDYVRQIAHWARRGYRVHHFFNVEGPKAIILALLAAGTTRLFRSPYSIGFIGGPRQRYSNQPGSFWGWLFQIVLARADFVICNNDEVKRSLRSFCSKAQKIHTIQCFHPSQVEHLGEVPRGVEAFLSDRRPAIASVIHPRRETNLPHHEMSLMLVAIGQLRNRHPRIGCVVLGGADCVTQYKAMASEARLQDHFHFVGEAAHKDCLATMERCDLFVRTYMKDGSSSSVREALALSIPTVASRNAQHPDRVISFEPNNPESLTAVLLDTLERLAEITGRLRDSPPSEEDGIERELALFGAKPASGTNVAEAAEGDTNRTLPASATASWQSKSG